MTITFKFVKLVLLSYFVILLDSGNCDTSSLSPEPKKDNLGHEGFSSDDASVSRSDKLFWDKEDFPDPTTMEGSIICGNNRIISWICDPSHVLTKAEFEEIDKTLNAWHNVAKCPCTNCKSTGPFFTIMLGIVPRISVDKRMMQTNTEKIAAIEEFAKYLRTVSWDHSNCDDNVILVLSVGDETIWTSAGKTARDLLTESCIDNIYEENIPILASRMYSIALQDFINEYISVFKRERNCTGSWPSALKYVAIIVASIIIILFLAEQLTQCLFHRSLFFCFRKKKSNVVEPDDVSVDNTESQNDIQAEAKEDSSSSLTTYSQEIPLHISDFFDHYRNSGSISSVSPIQSPTSESESFSRSSSSGHSLYKSVTKIKPKEKGNYYSSSQ